MSTAENEPIMRATELTKHYSVRKGPFGRSRQVKAAEGISLDLHRGRVTAVVGESGSGKSTLSRMLALTSLPTSGSLTFEGREINLTRSVNRSYRAGVQLVLQDPFASLNPVHRVRYILARPLKIHGLAGQDLDEKVKALLHKVSLDPVEQFIDKYPHELSGGQRQRVAIARALAVEPRVLLADEPVSMLDVSIRLGILNLLAELRDRDGLAILYVTHDIASARYLADTIMVMYAGRVVESGPAEQVTDSPRHPYTRLLISAAPDPDSVRAPWAGAAGAPPSLIDPPSGCRFHPRCPFAMPRCSHETPPLFTVSTNHRSACWLHVDETADATPTTGPP
jgi:peptide/nickel transport system ATP-binding protein